MQMKRAAGAPLVVCSNAEGNKHREKNNPKEPAQGFYFYLWGRLLWSTPDAAAQSAWVYQERPSGLEFVNIVLSFVHGLRQTQICLCIVRGFNSKI